MTVFMLDGKTYNVTVPAGGIKRSGRVTDGENVGRTISGLMIRDIIGTYYNYSISVDTRQTSLADYDELYETITAPVDSHVLKVPYGQGYMEFEAYITSADDTLEIMSEDGNRWKGLTISFIAMEPQRRP